MAFTKSLYYPWIDIQDENWLKSAALYWEKIQTIVPVSIESPYSNLTASYLHDEGFLVPLRVTSELEIIDQLADDVITYLNSQEGMALLTRADRRWVSLHPDKLPRQIHQLSKLHPEKISGEMRYILRHLGLSHDTRGGFLQVDNEFAAFYMTLLATRLAESIGAGLVTSSSLPHNLSMRAKVDAPIERAFSSRRWDEYELFRRNIHLPHELAQGMLLELMLEDINIAPETPIDRIVEYKKNHSTELGRLREQIGKLTSSFKEDVSLSVMRQQITDLYINDVKPALDDYKKSLSSNKIRWITNGWLKLAFLSIGSSSVLAGIGLSTANALLVGAGISLVGSAILYNADKQDVIQKNPYSYILSLQNEVS